MIAWFARNHVTANLLMIALLFAGLISLNFNIPLEVFPSFEPRKISVSVTLRGATPEDTELGLAIRIEEAIADLEGIEQITSRSVEGSSLVSVEVASGYEPREILADVKARVDAINTFPVDAQKPVVTLSSWKHDVMSVTVSGQLSEKEIRQYAENVRDDLLRLPEVSQAELDVVRNYEIAIHIDQDKLRQYELSLSDVATAIANSSSDLSAGNLKTQGGDLLIRSKGQAYYRNEFERITIKTNADGSLLQLGDIARVNDGFEEDPIRARFNGEPAAMIEIFRIGNQSAISVAEAVRDYISDNQHKLPVGLSLSYWDDDSEIVKKRLSTLTNNAIQGGILVLLLLTLFLRPAIAFWVFIGIPISFMGAFIVMPLFDISLNVLSLYGFILVLGIVVDDAIVTGENVYSHLRHSESGLQAAINGTREVALPVTFGVLTTIAAFIPIAFIEGFRGALFAQIPVVVIPILLLSLIESKFILPAHLKHLSLRNSNGGRLERWQQAFADNFEQSILKYYQPVLKRCIHHRYSTAAFFVGLLILVFAFVSSGWTKFTFFPRVPSETARVTLNMPAGTAFDVTDRYVEQMTLAATELQEKYRDPDTGYSVITNILSTTSSSNTGRVRFELTPAEERSSDITIHALVKEWRLMIGQLAGAESLSFRAEIGRGGDPIDIQLSASSLETLEKVIHQVRQQLQGYPEAFDIQDNLSDGKDELRIELTEQGHALGLTRSNVLRQVREAFFGIEVQRIQRGRDDIRVMLRLPISERNAVADLRNIQIEAPDNRLIPLSHIARLDSGTSPSAIYRVDRYRTVNVTADVDKKAVNMTALNKDLALFLDDLMQQYPGVSYTLEGEAREQRESFGSLQWGIIFVLFIIYSLLAIPFRSYSQPLIVMSVIPFGAIGAFVGHWIMSMNLTMMSLLGLMALTGMVVNDSLVLVDFINQRRKRAHESVQDAILKSGVARFRPVMLTSMTTFIGLMPLLFEESTQAQFLIPMAVSLGFGILFATFVTLIMIPVNYLILEDIKHLFSPKTQKTQPQNS